MLCIPLGVCSPSLAQSRPECAALPLSAQAVPPSQPLLTTPGAGSGFGRASTGTEEEHCHQGGQEDEVPLEPGCPSLEPWGGKCPSPRVLLHCSQADRRKFPGPHRDTSPNKPCVLTNSTPYTLCSLSSWGRCHHAWSGIPEQPHMPHAFLTYGKDQGEV